MILTWKPRENITINSMITRHFEKKNGFFNHFKAVKMLTVI